ncbi:MAG: nuclear transport factor 2 family protein [Candidatus Thiodiazotropha sp.]
MLPPAAHATDADTVVDQFVAAVNRGDESSVLALFGDNGKVNDWGRIYTGIEAIKRWSDREFLGADGRMTVNKRSTADNIVTLNVTWNSSYYSGGSIFIFTVSDGRIEEMRIEGH